MATKAGGPFGGSSHCNGLVSASVSEYLVNGRDNLWDSEGRFVGTVEVDEYGALPLRSTPPKPTRLTGAWSRVGAVARLARGVAD